MSVSEIEEALRQLTPQERLEIANRLLENLQESALTTGEVKETGGQPAQLPDYASRRRQIFGDKILPNMVLAARAEERW